MTTKRVNLDETLEDYHVYHRCHYCEGAGHTGIAYPLNTCPICNGKGLIKDNPAPDNPGQGEG